MDAAHLDVMTDHDIPNFLAAWRDLGERIERGIFTLNSFPSDVRRAAKAAGLDAASKAHRALYPDSEDRADYREAWTNFTQEVFAQWQVADAAGDAAFASGLALALEYQRGYSASIDAPGLPTLIRQASR